MVFHNKCPLCSSDKIIFSLRCTDHLVSGKEFDLFRCSDCSFVFTQGYPDEPDISSYYESEDYISHDDKAKGILNRIYIFSRDLMLRRKKSIVEGAVRHTTGKLLDIGCGTGYFAWTMKKSGWDVTGIEPNKKAREFGEISFGIDVREAGKVSDLPDESFDCITMWHVFEHLHDPHNYLSEIKRLLKSDGCCIMALPNRDSSDAGYYGKSWAAYDVPRHLWHFNPSTVKLFWEKEGFRIVNVKRLPLDVFYISILSEKNLASEIPFLKGMIRGIWFTLKAAVNKLRCSSLVFFLEKSDNQ